MDENRIGSCIVDTAVRIHRETGPGLFEAVYETILAHQLRENGFEVKRQVTIPI
jgi:GxxExxY protein